MRPSRRLRLWNGVPMLMTRPILYVALVLLLPSMVAALAGGALLSWWAAPLAFLGGLAVMWLVQYSFFQ